MSKSKKILIIAIFTLGIILRTIYIMNTSIYLYQHDVKDENGHLDYINCIYKTNHLPKTNEFQYYHPPLHHIICATWLKIFSGFIKGNTLYESLQALTLIFSVLLMYFQYKLIKKFQIKFIHEILIVLVISLWPRWIIFSGSLNNDLLSYLLMTVSLNYLISWYRNTNYKNTVLLAIFTGFSVMTKMSSVLLAVPIIYVFVKKLLEEIMEKKIKNLILYYSIFGLISLPIGLWYPIRNYLLFKQTLFYVLNPNIPEMRLTRNFMQTYLLLDFKELFDIFNNVWIHKNVLSYIIKGSFWGEFFFYNHVNEIILKSALIINGGIFLYSLYAILKETIVSNFKKTKNYVEKNILAIFCIFNLITFVLNGVRLPYIVSCDFRFIAMYILIASVFIVFRVESIKNRVLKRIVGMLLIISMLFIIIVSNIVIFYHLNI